MPPCPVWPRALLVLGVALPTAVALAAVGDEPQLAERHEVFLEEAALLLLEEEKAIFLDLDQDYQRDAFIERFWRERDPFPETPRNEFEERWRENLREARDRYDELESDRARMILLHGPPEREVVSRCNSLRNLDLWFYNSSLVMRGEFALVFVRQGKDFRLWKPHEGIRDLVLFGAASSPPEVAQLIERECTRSDQILTALAIALDMDEIEKRIDVVPRVGIEWAKSFIQSSTDLPEGAESLPAEIRIDFPGRHQSRTVVQTLVAVPTQSAETGEMGEYRSWNFLVDGEVLRRGELFDQFRYRFDIPAGEASPPESLPLVMQRYLRPGLYTLVVKLQDLNGERFFRESREIEVPNLRFASRDDERLTPLETPLPDEPLEMLDRLTEANATIRDQVSGSDDHTLRLEAPTGQLLTGKVRISARVTGQGVGRVHFELNGKPVFSKRSPPYSVELDLGRAPRIHTVTARAVDVQGELLASDELLLNTGPHRFAVRLIEPQRGRRYRYSVRAVAEVEVPEEEVLERVEFYLNDTLVATLFQPPFSQPILIPPDQALSYVRAVGVLASGSTSEDVVFVNSPNPIDEIEVNFVELYTSVLDGKGRPAAGLTADDFVVLEDGKEQAVRRFELVKDLPIHAGILLDTSTSMTDRLLEAEEAAMHFFQIVLTPRDRACLLTFDSEPQLMVRFTNSIEVLAGGLAGLVAEEETALYDSLIYALYYFSGIRGKRALILLSDGEDSASTYTFDEALEFARRTGVAIYAIGLSIPTKEVDVRNRLERFCRETGGSCFFVDRATELKAIYTRIQHELRSQYLIAYQSNQRGLGEEFREVELRVERPGLKAKTMRGYYP